MRETPIDDLDIIFISYDEPMKDEYWSKLLKQTPFARRVDGVTGFDAAHKQAAELAETDRFITIDGDTTVNDSFFDMVLKYDEDEFGDFVFSWSGTNEVNGLVYGNGSIKCWPTEATRVMQTHENAEDEKAKIEFCWSIPYLSMKDTYSTTHPAATPYHAFRAGMREGIKMGLDQGDRVEPKGMFDRLWGGNIHKLLTWASIGADHENGLWAIYGARMGLLSLIRQDIDYNMVSDYEWFPQFWEDTIKSHKMSADTPRMCVHTGHRWSPFYLVDEIKLMGDYIHRDTGTYIPLFTVEQSAFQKHLSKYRDKPTPRVLFEQD